MAIIEVAGMADFGGALTAGFMEWQIGAEKLSIIHTTSAPRQFPVAGMVAAMARHVLMLELGSDRQTEVSYDHRAGPPPGRCALRGY